MGWVVNATPRPLYPRERPGTHCIGGWVGPWAGLDRGGKSRPHRNSIPGPSSPQRVAIPAHYALLFSWQCYVGCLTLPEVIWFIEKKSGCSETERAIAGWWSVATEQAISDSLYYDTGSSRMCNTVVVVVILSGHMASWGLTTSLSPRPVCCMLSREQQQQPFLHRLCSLLFRI
jgi:hypothetical protein